MITYGPVLSRRLGYSLGIDIVKPKSCTLDCVYCQLGSQNAIGTQRSRYYEPDVVEEALAKCLDGIDQLDYITFAGSGEPTLSIDMGRYISFLDSNYPEFNIAVLTNSTLLHDDNVIEELRPVELIVPSLDASNPEQFKRINRPHPSVDFSRIISGLVKLRSKFDGELRLEIMLIAGVNDDDESLRRFAEIARKVKPDKIDINTPVRPPAEAWVKVPDAERIMRAEEILNGRTITKANSDGRKLEYLDELSNYMLSLLERRPETRENISEITNLPTTMIDKHIMKLIKLNKIYKKIIDGNVFYIAK